MTVPPRAFPSRLPNDLAESNPVRHPPDRPAARHPHRPDAAGGAGGAADRPRASRAPGLARARVRPAPHPSASCRPPPGPRPRPPLRARPPGRGDQLPFLGKAPPGGDVELVLVLEAAEQPAAPARDLRRIEGKVLIL